MTVDVDRRDALLGDLDEVREEHLARLREQGYIPEQPGCNKALQEIMRRLERRNPQIRFPRTAGGQYATSEEALQELMGVEPFVDALLAYKAVTKLQSAFLAKMGKRRVHPSFDVIKTTGRTSSFGEINAQNLPRDDRVRACFVPSNGNILIAADYCTLELAALGQVMISQFGQHSSMADAINQGRDLHRLVAARVTGKGEGAVTREERQKAKAINFGKPGGMGHNGLQRYAKAGYGVELCDEEVDALSDRWFELFPEMNAFLGRDDSLGRGVAKLFGLTPQSYYDVTGSRSFLDHPANVGRETTPHPILGAMALKVLRDPEPCRGDGRRYSPVEIGYFWLAVETQITTIPAKLHTAVRERRASFEMQRAVMRLADRAGVVTATGRLRANATWCARHNTLFRGLAADGAKLALWRLWRAGYRIVNFIHDEVLIEVPEGDNLTAHAERIKQIMIDAMHQVIPNVRIDVEYAAMRRWYKAAEAVFDEHGRLVPWKPNNPAEHGQEPALAANT